MQKKKSAKGAAAGIPKRNPRSAPAAKRKRRSPDDLMNRIVQAAAAEFMRCGFAGTTTAAIARKADVTEAQLFRYFGSKSNLFRESVFKPIDQHLQNFTNEHPPDFGEAAAVRRMTNLYTTELQRFISAHSEMFTSLVVAQTYDSAAGHGVSQINSLRTFFDHAASLMRARLKGTPKVDPDLLVRVTFGAVLANVMFRDWIFPPGLANDEQITAAVNAFVMEGVGANSTKD